MPLLLIKVHEFVDSGLHLNCFIVITDTTVSLPMHSRKQSSMKKELIVYVIVFILMHTPHTQWALGMNEYIAYFVCAFPPQNMNNNAVSYRCTLICMCVEQKCLHTHVTFVLLLCSRQCFWFMFVWWDFFCYVEWWMVLSQVWVQIFPLVVRNNRPFPFIFFFSF